MRPKPPLDWNATLYSQRHSFVWKYGEDLIDLLSPQPGERILDAGCGTGQLTAKLAATGARVTGLDNSPAMIEAARAACPSADFLLDSLTDFHPPEPFDAIFSNAVLHWVRPPEDAARCMAAALKPGGRFVAELGGTGNVATLLNAANALLGERGHAPRQPWYFPSIAEYAAVLEQAGLEVTYAILFDRLTPLEGGDEGLANWFEVFGRTLVQAEPEWRASLLPALKERVRPILFDPSSQQWSADYRRLRIAARKPL